MFIQHVFCFISLVISSLSAFFLNILWEGDAFSGFKVHIFICDRKFVAQKEGEKVPGIYGLVFKISMFSGIIIFCFVLLHLIILTLLEFLLIYSLFVIKYGFIIWLVYSIFMVIIFFYLALLRHFCLRIKRLN